MMIIQGTVQESQQDSHIVLLDVNLIMVNKVCNQLSVLCIFLVF